MKGLAVVVALVLIIGGYAAGGAFDGLGEALRRGIAAARAPTPAPAPAPTTNEDAASRGSPSNGSGSSSPVAASVGEVPDGYILEESCQSGTGKTGKTIYYRARTSDLRDYSSSYSFVCVHKAGESPNDQLGDAFYTRLADMSGNHCAFSKANNNVGCALGPITEDDLMGPLPPPVSQAGVPAGYVLEDCKSGTGATGKTVYFWPPIHGGSTGTTLFECVHHQGATGYLSVTTPVALERNIAQDGPYCAFSEADKNIGCALTPITSKDLMAPS